MSATPELEGGAVNLSSSQACSADGRVLAMQGSIRALYARASVCGPARTARTAPGDNTALHLAVHAARAGEVIVVDAGGDMRHGFFGDLLATSCLARGISGLVIDGCVRDVAEIEEMGFPVFSLGACPGQTSKTGPGEIDVDIECGGARVRPGDLVVADRDGVGVVPREVVVEVLEAAEAVREREVQVRRRLVDGASTLEVFGLRERAGGPRDEQSEQP